MKAASLGSGLRRARAARLHFAQLAHATAHEVSALRAVEHGLSDSMTVPQVRRMLDGMIRERQQRLVMISGEGGNA